MPCSSQIASKPKSLAVTVSRDSGDGEGSQAQRHYREKGGKTSLVECPQPGKRKAMTGLRGGSELGKQAKITSANLEHLEEWTALMEKSREITQKRLKREGKR